MTMLNPQAIVAGLGRPLTPVEARVVMLHNSKKAKTHPKALLVPRVRPTPQPRMDLLEHITGDTPTKEIACAANYNTTCTLRALNVLEDAGYIKRRRVRGMHALWSRVERNRGSGK